LADAIGILGAVTGSLGLALAGGREIAERRARLALNHGIDVLLSEPRDAIEDAWLMVRLWNRGRRSVPIESVWIEFSVSWVEGETFHVEHPPQRAHVDLGNHALVLGRDGPSTKLYVPLNTVTALGIDPLNDPVNAFAQRTGGHVWRGPLHPIVDPPFTPPLLDLLRDYLERTGAGPPTARPAPPYLLPRVKLGREIKTA
jgi:hypothetical protein